MPDSRYKSSTLGKNQYSQRSTYVSVATWMSKYRKTHFEQRLYLSEKNRKASKLVE